MSGITLLYSEHLFLFLTYGFATKIAVSGTYSSQKDKLTTPITKAFRGVEFVEGVDFMVTYCLLGDRAFIIRSEAGNEGKVVIIRRCLGDLPSGPFSYLGRMFFNKTPDVVWVVESEGAPILSIIDGKISKNRFCALPDSWLRPLTTDID